MPPPPAPEVTRRNQLGFWLGLAVFAAVVFGADIEPGKPAVTSTAAIALLMAVWWVTEAVPVAVTALLPLVLFPLFGVVRGSEIAPVYLNNNIFLFAGGFLIALAMERWNLHRRIALLILSALGGGPHRLVLGFMVATAFLSMWISNTATAMMMMPMGLSLALLYEELLSQETEAGQTPDPRAANFSLVLMLGIAYGSSIGGVATIIGTPPNVVLTQIFHAEFPEAPPISFAQWIIFAFPLTVTFLLASWFMLGRLIYPLPARTPFSGSALIGEELRRLGPYGREERLVTAVFVTAAFLWMFREDIRFGEAFALPGWSSLLKHGAMIDDGTIAIAMGTLLFMLPARGGGRIMNWETARKLPWGILWLFGGGFALAKGITESELSIWIGRKFEVLEGAPAWAVIVAISGTITGVTELTSNTATTQMVLPILAALARSIEVHPLMFMIPATLSASCAFMLPVATPPNAIVYGSERVSITQMAWAGLFMNLLGLALIAVFIYTLALPVFQISADVFPAWASAAAPSP